MKKVLSIVLSLVMVLCMMPAMAFAGTDAAYTDIAGETCETAVTTLSDLGVVDGYPDGSYKPEATVTRAEAAKLIIAALGLSEEAAGTKASFTDLAGYDWAQGYIGYAESLGILMGDGNGLYRPGDVVSYNEMAAIVIRALGYTDVTLQGQFPAAHVAKAKALGVFTDVVSGGSAGADRGDCAIMIFNVLGKDIKAADKDGAVTSTGTSMLSLLGATPQAAAIVTLADARNSKVDLFDLIGAKAVLYKNSKSEIVAIGEVETTFLTGEFNSNTEFESDGVKYTVTATDSFKAYNNGVYATDLTPTSITKDSVRTIAVTISGKTITDIVSSKAWTGTDIQWDKANIKEVAKAAPTFEGTPLPLNTNKEIDYTQFKLVGADSFASIPEDAIVTYYANGTFVKFEVSTATVTGKVTQVAGNGDVTINGTVYPVCNAVALGTEGTFYLNAAGKVCVVEGVSTTVNYGIVLLDKNTASPAYGEEAVTKIKILTATGEKTVFTVNKDKVASVTATAGELTAYKLNGAGEITEAVAVTGGTDATGRYVNGYIDGLKIADNVVVFKGTSVANYAAGSLSTIPVNEDLTGAGVTYYVVDGKVQIIMNNSATADTVYGFVTAVDKVYNADNDEVRQITLADGSKYLTTTSCATPVTANSGNLVKFTLTNGEISTIADHGLSSPALVASATVVAVDDTALDTNKTDYVQINASAKVFEIVDGKVVAATYADIAEDDLINLYDTNADKYDGYDIIIIVA